MLLLCVYFSHKIKVLPLPSDTLAKSMCYELFISGEIKIMPSYQNPITHFFNWLKSFFTRSSSAKISPPTTNKITSISSGPDLPDLPHVSQKKSDSAFDQQRNPQEKNEARLLESNMTEEKLPESMVKVPNSEEFEEEAIFGPGIISKKLSNLHIPQALDLKVPTDPEYEAHKESIEHLDSGISESESDSETDTEDEIDKSGTFINYSNDEDKSLDKSGTFFDLGKGDRGSIALLKKETPQGEFMKHLESSDFSSKERACAEDDIQTQGGLFMKLLGNDASRGEAWPLIADRKKERRADEAAQIFGKAFGGSPLGKHKPKPINSSTESENKGTITRRK